MVEIIQHGVLDKRPDPKRTFVCLECRCVFKCDKEDYVSTWQYNESGCYSKCPECGSRALEKRTRG